jgi:hypothetical protein
MAARRATKETSAPSPKTFAVCCGRFFDRFEGWTAAESLPGAPWNKSKRGFLPEQGSLMDSWWAQPNASE